MSVVGFGQLLFVFDHLFMDGPFALNREIQGILPKGEDRSDVLVIVHHQGVGNAVPHQVSTPPFKPVAISRSRLQCELISAVELPAVRQDDAPYQWWSIGTQKVYRRHAGGVATTV